MTGVIGLSLIPVSKPMRLEAGLEEARVLPQPIDQLRLLDEHVERGDAGGRDRGRVRRGEQEGPGAMVQKVDEVPASGDVAAEGADRLRERAHLHVHTPVHAEVIDGAAAVLPEHAARVRIVHHHDAAELFGQIAQGGQRTEVAIHAEDAVRDQELALGGRQLLQDRAGRVDVLVREDLDRGAAQAAAIDDARVIQRV